MQKQQHSHKHTHTRTLIHSHTYTHIRRTCCSTAGGGVAPAGSAASSARHDWLARCAHARTMGAVGAGTAWLAAPDGEDVGSGGGVAGVGVPAGGKGWELRGRTHVRGCGVLAAVRALFTAPVRAPMGTLVRTHAHVRIHTQAHSTRLRPAAPPPPAARAAPTAPQPAAPQSPARPAPRPPPPRPPLPRAPPPSRAPLRP